MPGYYVTAAHRIVKELNRPRTHLVRFQETKTIQTNGATKLLLKRAVKLMSITFLPAEHEHEI